MGVNPFDPALFRAEAISAEVRAFNDAFLRRMAEMPPLGAGPNDEQAPTPFPPQPKCLRATVRKVGTQAGRQVPVRIIPPATGNPRGAYLHLHGGGLVFGSADQDDPMLERIANATGLAAVSVEYRLAPAPPLPCRLG